MINALRLAIQCLRRRGNPAGPVDPPPQPDPPSPSSGIYGPEYGPEYE